MLDEALGQWRNPPPGKHLCLVLVARYKKVGYCGSVSSAAVLVAVGINKLGYCSILGVSVSRSEAEVCWRTSLDDLNKRGLHGMQMVVSDDHAGLKQTLCSVFPGVPWNRCQFHLQHNAANYVPRILRHGTNRGA